MAERTKAVDLRPTIVKMRGFEPLFVHKNKTSIIVIQNNLKTIRIYNMGMASNSKKKKNYHKDKNL